MPIDLDLFMSHMRGRGLVEVFLRGHLWVGLFTMPEMRRASAYGSLRSRSFWAPVGRVSLCLATDKLETYRDIWRKP